MEDRILIFDTTLRDGEQCPGASLNTYEKLEIAKNLEKLKVDVIEAGFPIASPGDFEGVKLIAQTIKGCTIAGLARATKKDIERTWEAVKYSDRPRIHTFIATSPIHMKYKLQLTPEQVLEQAVEAVKYAVKLCSEVEFSAEDASRSEKEFLFRIFEEVIKVGATIINIPDTVGYAQPEEFGNLIKDIKEKVPNIGKAVISVHCHNDLGLAVANSLEAIKNGATQVECTINGIGERAGNASLEEIVMALKTRIDIYHKTTGINTSHIYPLSRLVSKLTGFTVQPNKAIVGGNAFAHEAGIHQDGILKERTTYEIMTPKSIGLEKSSLVLGKHSGRNALKNRLEEMGYILDREKLNEVFEKFKLLADKKKEIFVEDLEVIVSEEVMGQIAETYKLEYFQVNTGNKTLPTATIRLLYQDKQHLEDAACGDGPVDASFKAIDRITKLKLKLIDYNVQALTKGKDAQGEVIVRIKNEKGNIFTGRGTSTDTLEASILAYLNAVNKMVFN
ncbi:MAG: 2-isopropylmalate synthase [Candidatus Caldatribacteriota bacterium]